MIDGLNKTQKEMDWNVRSMLPAVRELPEPQKSRCLFSLAYEYINLDMEELAFPLLEEADPNYFKEQLNEDMKTVPHMGEMVSRIMSKLIDMGFIKVEVKDEN